MITRQNQDRSYGVDKQSDSIQKLIHKGMG